VAEHCGIVREKSMLRRLIASSTRLLEDAYTGERSALEIADAATEEIGALLTGQSDQGPRHIRRCFEEASRGWEQVMAGKVEGGVSTGLQDLDRILFSLRPGKHIVIAARPGFGKSALALQIAARSGVPSCLYSLEMLATEEVERVLAQHCGVDSSAFADAARLRYEWERIQEAIREMQDLPIWISDDSTVTPARITAQARAMKRRRGLGLLVVDYLQLVATAYQKGITREREVAMISSSLKRLSMQVQIPVLSVASLSRDCEKRENKRPVLADLRESGNIESDADTVIFLYKHAEYDREMPKALKDIVEIDVRKNRGGKKGVALARFEDHAVRFHGLNEQQKEEYSQYVKGVHWNSPEKKSKYAPSGRDKAAGE
jgi:replicative DNA helicase